MKKTFKGFDPQKQQKFVKKLEELHIEEEAAMANLERLLATDCGRKAINGVIDAIAGIPSQDNHPSYVEAYTQGFLEVQTASNQERQALTEMLPVVRKLINL